MNSMHGTQMSLEKANGIGNNITQVICGDWPKASHMLGERPNH